MSAADVIPHADAVALAEKIVALDGVAELNSGTFGSVALLYPGDRVAGLQLTSPRDSVGQHLEVCITADVSAIDSLEALSDRVRETARAATSQLGLPVDVTVADVVATSGTGSL